MSTFWDKLFKSPYVRLLERENAELKAERKALLLALLPRLQLGTEKSLQAPVNGSSPQSVRPADNGEGTKAPVRLKRPSWQEARARAEYLSDAELRESERLQKVKESYQ